MNMTVATLPNEQTQSSAVIMVASACRHDIVAFLEQPVALIINVPDTCTSQRIAVCFCLARAAGLHKH